MSEKRFYTVGEVGEMLNISRGSVYALIKRGEFRVVVAGGKYIVSKASFDEWLDQNISEKEKSKSR